MKHTVYSHCAGDKAVPPSLQRDVVDAIKHVTVKPTKGAATKIRDEILASLKTSGWSGEVTVSNDSDMTITSMKEEVGCVCRPATWRGCMQT